MLVRASVSAPLPARLAAVLVAAFAATLTLVVVGFGTVAAGPPETPPPQPGISKQSVIITEQGATVAMAMDPQPTPGPGGDNVGLGGTAQCGEFGCTVYVVGWSIAYDMTVVDGCTATSWTCSVRYEPRPYERVSHSMVIASFGTTARASYHQEFLVWSPPTISFLEVGLVDPIAGGLLRAYSPAYAVRAGTSPTIDDCEGPGWWEDQLDTVAPQPPDCIRLFDQGQFSERWSVYLPIGTGPWIVFPNVTGQTGLVANAAQQRYTIAGAAGRFGNLNIPSMPAQNLVLDAVFVADGTGSSTPTTTSIATSVPVGSAPPPPVITSASTGGVGSGGVVRGTIDGQPGAEVTVSIAHGAGGSCPRQMSGSGVTAIGDVTVTIEPDGESPFEVTGPVPGGGWVYGTASTTTATSSVGECFAVAAAATTTTGPVPTSSTPGTPTTATVPASSTPASSTPASSSSGSTVTSDELSPGATRIPVASQAGFDIGDRVRIGVGAQQEVRTVVGFGSLIVDAPLRFAHPSGTPVVEVAPSEPSGPLVTGTLPATGAGDHTGTWLLVALLALAGGAGLARIARSPEQGHD